MRVRSRLIRHTPYLMAAVALLPAAGCGPEHGDGPVARPTTAAPPVTAAATTTVAPPPSTAVTPPVETDPAGPAPIAAGCVPRDATTQLAGEPAGAWQFAEVNPKWQVAFRPNAGPLGAVVVVGDSLTKASLHETMAKLAAAGFGPICIDAGFGRYLGRHHEPTEPTSAVEVIARIRSSDPAWSAADVRWVVAAGTNDVGWTKPAAVEAFAAEQITAAREAIGPTAVPPYWVNVGTRRETAATVERVWNEQLLRAGVVIDWVDAVGPQPDLYIGSDLIHLTAEGIELRSDLIVRALTKPLAEGTL